MSDLKQRRFRRKKYLINRSFQLKSSLYIALSGLIGSVLVATVMYWWWARNNMYMEKMGLLDPEFTEANRFVIASLAIFVIFTVTALFVWGIFITHRVAGPLYVIHQYIKEVLDGKWPEARCLRRRDYFKEVFYDFNVMISKIKKRENTSNE